MYKKDVIPTQMTQYGIHIMDVNTLKLTLTVCTLASYSLFPFKCNLLEFIVRKTEKLSKYLQTALYLPKS